MQKKKFRFNIMDALILLVILASISVLLYVFVLSEHNSVDSLTNTDTARITYVIEVSDLDESCLELVKAGQNAIDSSKKMNIGTVTAVESQEYVYLGTDKINGTVTLNRSDSRISLYITIEADASTAGISYSVNGFDVYVGAPVYLALPNFVCSGYCIALNVNP